MNTDRQKLTLREIQLEELNILLKARDFLEANNLRYFICGGTLLGAVRHGGFIPWDDDIDVFVPREDFERLRKMAAEDRNIISGLKICLPCDENYAYPFIKICNPDIVVKSYAEKNTGVDNYLWVDIFPMDYLPDNALLRRLCICFQQVQKKSMRASMHSEEFSEVLGWKNGAFRKLVAAAAKILFRLLGGFKKIPGNLDAFAKYIDRKYKGSQRAGNICWPNGMKDHYNVSCFSAITKIKFEGYEFNAPEQYDEFLTGFYGDYMTPPPEDKRQAHYLTAYMVKV